MQASQTRLFGSELPAVVPELPFDRTFQGSFLTSTSLHDSDRRIHYKSSRSHFDCNLMKAVDSLAQRFVGLVLKFESGDWRAGLSGYGCEVKLLPLRNSEVEQTVRNEVIRRPYF